MLKQRFLFKKEDNDNNATNRNNNKNDDDDDNDDEQDEEQKEKKNLKKQQQQDENQLDELDNLNEIKYLNRINDRQQSKLNDVSLIKEQSKPLLFVDKLFNRTSTSTSSNSSKSRSKSKEAKSKTQSLRPPPTIQITSSSDTDLRITIDNTNKVTTPRFVKRRNNESESCFIRNKKKFNLNPEISFDDSNISQSDATLADLDLSNAKNFNDDLIFHYYNRPQDSNCSQQRLLAWKPMLTPKFVINLFLICSILFVPIGIILYFTSNSIYEFQYDYTDCNDTRSPNETCHSQMLKNSSYKCVCRVYFNETRFQDETLFVYYLLENFYQNERRYDRSRDYDQLLGGRTGDYLSSECEPFRYHKKSNNLKLKYAPCGAVANSKFNDTFSIYFIQKNQNESIKVNISKKNLAWNSDREYKFKNPNDFSNTIKPPNWAVNITQLEEGYRNEDLIVWMRTAAFPSFRKLYGRILVEENSKLAQSIPKSNMSYFTSFFKSDNQNKEVNNLEYQSNQLELPYSNQTLIKQEKNQNLIKMYKAAFFETNSIVRYRLPKGQYYVDIEYRFLVKQFNGRKHFVLANVSWIGGRCYFMAWSYIVIGCVCFIAAIVLFFLHVYFGNMHYNTAILLVDTTTSLVK